MITSRRIKEQTQEVIVGLKRRGIDNAEELIKEVIALDNTRKEYKNTLDELLRQTNLKTGIIERKLKNNEDISLIKNEVLDIKNDVADLKYKLGAIEKELVHLLYDIPNVPNVNIPDGASSGRSAAVCAGRDVPVSPGLAPDRDPVCSDVCRGADHDAQKSGASDEAPECQGAGIRAAGGDHLQRTHVSRSLHHSGPKLPVRLADASLSGQHGSGCCLSGGLCALR